MPRSAATTSPPGKPFRRLRSGSALLGLLLFFSPIPLWAETEETPPILAPMELRPSDGGEPHGGKATIPARPSSASPTIPPAPLTKRPILSHTSVKEEAVAESPGGTELLTPGMVERLAVEGGAPTFAVRLAEQGVKRAVGQENSARWTAAQLTALLQSGRHGEARSIAERLPEELFALYPTLTLLRADALLGEGRYAEARRLYSDFLLHHADHPDHLKAQRGVGLAALRLGSLQEAELQLGLYAEEPQRPRLDPLLLEGLVELYEQKGMAEQAWSHLKQLAALPMEIPEARAARRRLARSYADAGENGSALAEWRRLAQYEAIPPAEREELRIAMSDFFVTLGLWPEAVEQAELLLHEKETPQALARHANLYLRWLSAVDAGEGGSRSGKSGAKTSALESACTPVYQTIRRHRFWLSGLRAARNDPPRQLPYLERLLYWERTEKLGLLQDGGLLTPKLLGLEPLIPEARILYADAYRRAGRWQDVRTLLNGLGGAEADAQRLLLAAVGQDMGESLSTLLPRLAPTAVGWTPRTGHALLETAALFAAKGDTMIANQIRQWAASKAGEITSVARAIRYYQAQERRQRGDVDGALALYLSVLYDQERRDESNVGEIFMLPEDPRRLAADILSGQGYVADAQALQSAMSFPRGSGVNDGEEALCGKGGNLGDKQGKKAAEAGSGQSKKEGKKRKESKK